MKRVVFLIVLALVAAVGVFAAALVAYPTIAMDRAMTRLSAEGTALNTWRHAPQIKAESRAVVRPGPDLAYSSCAYDLWRGPVRIAVTPSAIYWSLALYDAQTNAFAVFNDVTDPQGVEIVLVRPGAAPPSGAERVIESPTRRGVALVRRFAPDAAAFAAADQARQGDVCGLLER